MPHSFPNWIEAAAYKILAEQPQSVLDVGLGFGMGGMIARQYADIWHLRIQPGDWAVVIDGIEIHAPNVMPHQTALYNTIHIGDAVAILPTLGHYDLILCIDMLEHLHKVDGTWLLDLIAEHGTHFLVSTPADFFEQDALQGNAAERHLACWTASELERWGTVSKHDSPLHESLLLLER